MHASLVVRLRELQDEAPDQIGRDLRNLCYSLGFTERQEVAQFLLVER